MRYRMMQISPELPSLMMRSKVSRSFPRAASGIWLSLLDSPSLTSSCRDFPKILDSQIFDSSPSNSCSRYSTSSSDCFSLPTVGEIVVLISAFIIWMDGADAVSLTPNWLPCLTSSGISSVSSSMPGVTIP